MNFDRSRKGEKWVGRVAMAGLEVFGWFSLAERVDFWACESRLIAQRQF